MAILALATSGPDGEVGLRTREGLVLLRPLGSGSARGRGVMPAIRALLEEATLGARDLEAVAVDVGPGSFTGVRVGVTTAKTLALALHLPVVGVSSLEALTHDAPPERQVLAVRDAGRGGIYFARFGPRLEARRETGGEAGRAPALEVLSAAGGSLVVGEEAPALLSRAGVEGEALETHAGAAAVLATALPRLAEARAALSEDGASAAHALVPVYLQASAPERRRAREVDDGPAGSGSRDRT